MFVLGFPENIYTVCLKKNVQPSENAGNNHKIVKKNNQQKQDKQDNKDNKEEGMPSCTPAGILIVMISSLLTIPSPWQSWHLFFIMRPSPPHCGHALWVRRFNYAY